MVNYHAVRLSRETLDSKRRDTPMLLRFLMGVARKFRILAMVKRPSNTNATEERTPSRLLCSSRIGNSRVIDSTLREGPYMNELRVMISGRIERNTYFVPYGTRAQYYQVFYHLEAL